MDEIGEAPRCPVSLQVVGAGAGHLGQLGEAARDMGHVAQAAEAQHAVDALTDEVDVAVADRDVQMDLRIRRAEAGQGGQQHQPAQ